MDIIYLNICTYGEESDVSGENFIGDKELQAFAVYHMLWRGRNLDDTMDRVHSTHLGDKQYVIIIV